MSTLEQIFRNAGLKVRSYSGRAMYGKYCLAVTTDDLGDLLATIAADPKSRDFVHDLRGVREDSMGRGVVYYFPNIPMAEWSSDDDE